MRFDLLTIFPDYFTSCFGVSLLGKGAAAGRLQIHIHNIRDSATDRHKTTDDLPYGGGPGMVMKAEPIARSFESLPKMEKRQTLLLSAGGALFEQRMARELSGLEQVILICGRYEGVDDRVRKGIVDREVSIGNYVLNGGEAAASVIVEAVARLLPGLLGNAASLEEESFESGLLEYPHFTRPAEFRGETVPKVLLTGNHKEIAKWRRREALLRTARSRPDLLRDLKLTPEEEGWIKEVANFSETR